MSGALATAGAQSERGERFNFREAGGIPGLRRDLQITQVAFRRRRNWVVKDPVSLRYFRWGEWDYRVAKLLDGKRGFDEIGAELSRAFDGREVDVEAVRATVNQLLSNGLLRNTGTVARQLHEQQRELTKRKKSRMFFLTLASKVISFKVTLFDPDLLLMRMSKRLRFLWSPGAAFVLLVMLLASGWLLLANRDSLSERMPDLLGWENLAILWVVLIVVKIVHEFGHGLSCKHYGGEVHEMGAMFIIFSPFLFCNASDSWTFRDKGKRLVVNAAGIYLELFLASVAATLWVITEPGLFNQICFNVMLVCSVITIFFNANPLMKFDGYYALSDWMEVPNLKERGDRALISGLTAMLTGSEGMTSDPIVAQMRGRIIFYAVASYVWIFLVAYRILSAMGQMLEPYGLDRIFQATASLALLTGVLAPPIMVALQVRKILANDPDSAIRRKVLRRSLAGAGLLALILAVPFPLNVRSTCVIDAANRVRITASTPGYVGEIEAKDGQHVAKDGTIAVLRNPEAKRQEEDYRLRLAGLRAAVVAAEADPAYRKESAGLRLQEEQLETALQQAALDRERLVLRSPVSGVISGRDVAEKRGVLLRRGDLLCEVLPDGPVEAVVALGESDAGEVRPGQKVSFRLNSMASATHEGKVIEVTEQPVASLPHQSLGEYAGGTVPSVMAPPPPGSDNPSQPVALPSGEIFAVHVAIEDESDLLRPGMSGRIKIHCGRRPLGVVLWRKFTSMLRTDFRL